MNKKQALMSGDRCQVLLIAAALLWPNYGYAQPNLLDAFKSLIQGIQAAPNQQATRSLRSQEPFVDVDNKLKQCSSSSAYHLCWGDFTFSDGYTYVGMWAHDKRDGLGTSIAPDGVQYFGLWKGGRPEKLIKFNPSGVVADSGVYDYTYKLLKYEKLEPVDFLASKKQLPHEAANKTNEESALISTQCPRNVPSYQWTDCIGSVNYGKATYEGEYKDGVRSGKGTLSWNSGGVISSGIWSRDQFVGPKFDYQIPLADGLAVVGSDTAETKLYVPPPDDSPAIADRTTRQLPACQGETISLWHECFGDISRVPKDKSLLATLGSVNFEYVGEFERGLPHGRGTYKNSYGQSYEGAFRAGKFYGEGVLYSPAREIIGSGTWRNDILVKRHDVTLASVSVATLKRPQPPTAPQLDGSEDERYRLESFEKWQSDEVKRIDALTKQSSQVQAAVVTKPSELELALIQADRLKQEKAELEAQLAAAQQAQVRPVAPVGPTLSVHAIVIGNGAYKGSGRLDNPINDARAISAKLKGMGFKVTLVENADRNKLVSSLVKFSSSAAESDLTLFFYAGHGVQISGTNYMLPTDTNLNQIGGVPLHGISLNSVVDQFLPGKTKLVFLDACRDNPLLQVASRGVSRGLAPISVSQGTLISYATKDGSVAADGEGKNSPFTKALLQHIDTPEDIAVVLRKVRDQVMRDTGGQQQPWEYGSLSGGSLILSAIRAK